MGVIRGARTGHFTGGAEGKTTHGQERGGPGYSSNEAEPQPGDTGRTKDGDEHRREDGDEHAHRQPGKAGVAAGDDGKDKPGEHTADHPPAKEDGHGNEVKRHGAS